MSQQIQFNGSEKKKKNLYEKAKRKFLIWQSKKRLFYFISVYCNILHVIVSSLNHSILINRITSYKRLSHSIAHTKVQKYPPYIPGYNCAIARYLLEPIEQWNEYPIYESC